MLAKTGDKPFSDLQWLFEVKWDGYRAVAEIQKQHIKLYSRNGLSFENKYHDVVTALQEIKHNMVLDGEIVVLDEEAKPNFQLLQHYPDVPEGCNLVYYVFDLLQLEGKKLYDVPLTERKKKLEKIIPSTSIIRYCEHVTGEGETFFKWVLKHNLEGMMAKKSDSLYLVNKRSSEWLKIRNHNITEAIICGFTAPNGERAHFGSLILGIYDAKHELHYAGHVGTGFTDQSLKELFVQMNKLKVETSPFPQPIKVNAAVTWIKPALVCNIKYTEWTSNKQLRHPVFMGLRVDKISNEVIETSSAMETKSNKSKTERLASAKSTITKVGTQQVKLSNQDKIYFPEDHLTKGDVIAYYQSVYDYIIPYLKNRPESLKRNPNGIDDKGFFHKDAGEGAPKWVKSIALHSESANKDIDYILCNDRATLMYLNNLGCIEINPWNSRIAKLDHPDYMVIDIDPSDKNTFEQVIQTALVVKKVLDKAGAVSFCKTSGATGLHVYVPMGARYTYEQVKDFAKLIAMLVQEQLPEFTTLERPLNKRKNRIYIDFLQNRQGQTLACAYSLRPRAGATVSAPLDWKEVKKGLSPSRFTIHTIQKRLAAKGDLFAGVLGKGINLENCLKKLMHE
ncbi:MAG: ligD [Chitinophagaceae bacterium]|nr:ligD [Chitinophagaceae bacterium]